MNTVEGAIVLSAITLVAGGAAAGLVTMSQAASSQSLARTVARAEARGGDGVALAKQIDATAAVSTSREGRAESPLVRVKVTKDGALFDVHGEAVTLVEPDGE
ncbi:hypothetical protein [uncultured Corynebacterium sp.]|uniref:hypothetical protein n=1 Tax=uncultured Corynebacterium sp. TaxID=159447 RepID=UPI0025F6A660|nr:hypothetical protein [uncultured Corynebacterium sp.]